MLHLLYARFVCHFLANEGLVSDREPFKQLVMMGMVKGNTYMVKHTGLYLTRDQVDFSGKFGIVRIQVCNPSFFLKESISSVRKGMHFLGGS